MKEHGRMATTVLHVLILGIAGATTWYVHPDSALSSIQAGLNSCAVGDTVLVGPGTYPGGDSWPQVADITLCSALGPDSTIIDGANLASGLRLSFVPGHARIQGLAIKSCYSDFLGAGIWAIECTLTVEDCVLWDNTARLAGGMAFEYGRYTIRRCRIYNNETILYPPGGIDFGFNCFALVESCTVTGNQGGGIGFAAGGATTIRHCDIFANRGMGVGYGGGPSWVADARYNWWGHATGPYHPTLNPTGLGDSVSDYVEFEPWLAAPTGLAAAPPREVLIPDRWPTIVGSITPPASAAIIRLFDALGRRACAPTPGSYFCKQSQGSRKLILVR